MVKFVSTNAVLSTQSPYVSGYRSLLKAPVLVPSSVGDSGYAPTTAVRDPNCCEKVICVLLFQTLHLQISDFDQFLQIVRVSCIQTPLYATNAHSREVVGKEAALGDTVVTGFMMFEAEVGDVIAEGKQEVVIAVVARAEESADFIDQVAVLGNAFQNSKSRPNSFWLTGSNYCGASSRGAIAWDRSG